MVAVFNSQFCRTPAPEPVAASVAAANERAAASGARRDRLIGRIAALEGEIAALRGRNAALAAENRDLNARLGERETLLRLRVERRMQAAQDRSRDMAMVQAVKAIVARHSGVSPAALIGPRRGRVVAGPRQMLCYLAHAHCPGASLPRIGRAINRDHTTVMHATRIVAVRLAVGGAATRALHDACLPDVLEAVRAIAAKGAGDEGEGEASFETHPAGAPQDEAQLQGESHGQG